jgi:uncharacterized protein with GYD domain
MTFAILSRFAPGSFETPADLKARAEAVTDRIEADCDVAWKDSYMLGGSYDVLDLVEADDPKEVQRAALVLRAFGNERTETCVATPWDEMLDAI